MRNSGSNFLLAPGKAFTVQNGGRADFGFGGYTTPVNTVYNISGTNSRWQLSVGPTAILKIENGAK